LSALRSLVLLVLCAAACRVLPAATPRDELERRATRTALDQLEVDGADLSKEHPVDFLVSAADDATARRIARGAREIGFRTEILAGRNDSWTVVCTRSMLPTEAAILEAEARLAPVAEEHGGRVAGWGTVPVDPAK
jgi:regulator of RNase E activity RraB